MRLGDLRRRACLSNWFPLVKDAGLPVPETRIIHTDCDLDQLCDGVQPIGYEIFLRELRSAVESIGLPAFLRTGQTSGKHDWKETCYLTDMGRLSRHVYKLVEFSAIVDLIGLYTDVWAVREFLPSQPAFHAFYGRMPITQERRYFVEGDTILCHHAYWPEGAIESNYPSVPNWKSLLDSLNEETPAEIKELSELTRKVGKAVDGAWSVDWLWTERGWFLIDMAPAESSYHWPGCKNEQLCLI